MVSETAWAILHVRMMRWMGKMRLMKKIQILASWAKMTNLAGWWAQSPIRYSTAWRVFGRSRWGLTNWCNQDAGTQLTASVREICSMGWLNWSFRQLLSPKQTWLHPHHHRHHLESLCRLMIFSPDNHKCRKGRLDWEVVTCGSVRRNQTDTVTQHISFEMWCPSITNGDCETCWTDKLLALHIESLADYHIEIWFRRWHSDGSHITRERDSQIGMLDDVSRIHAIWVSMLFSGSFCWISVTELCDRIIRHGVCKGRTGHAKHLDSKSSL